MSGSLFINFTPYLDDAVQALTTIQVALVNKSFNIETLCQEQLDEARANLLESRGGEAEDRIRRYRDEISFLEHQATKLIPETAELKLAYVREVFKYDEVGFGNILDIRDVSESQRRFAAAPAPVQSIRAVIGHVRPSQSEARTIAFGLKPTLGDAECVYFPVYVDGQKTPSELCFVGKTLG